MDDEELIRSTAAAMLTRLGYQSSLVPDGKAAVDAYRSARTDGTPYDAVILDLTIPGGMGGIEAVKHILDLDPTAKALVSSGYSESAALAQYGRYGFRGIITKPYSLETMGRTLQSVLNTSA